MLIIYINLNIDHTNNAIIILLHVTFGLLMYIIIITIMNIWEALSIIDHLAVCVQFSWLIEYDRAIKSKPYFRRRWFLGRHSEEFREIIRLERHRPIKKNKKKTQTFNGDQLWLIVAHIADIYRKFGILVV